MIAATIATVGANLRVRLLQPAKFPAQFRENCHCEPARTLAWHSFGKILRIVTFLDCRTSNKLAALPQRSLQLQI